MARVHAFLGGSTIVVTRDVLVELAEGVSEPLAAFVLSAGRWPAASEKPPLGYEGDADEFDVAGRAGVAGFFRVKEGVMSGCSMLSSSVAYFDVAKCSALEANGYFRLPFLLGPSRSGVAAGVTVSMNIFMKKEQRFVRDARLTHALPAAPEPLQHAGAGRAAPSAEDLGRRRFQVAAVAASAFDSQPYVEDEDGAGAADGDTSGAGGEPRH